MPHSISLRKPRPKESKGCIVHSDFVTTNPDGKTWAKQAIDLDLLFALENVEILQPDVIFIFDVSTDFGTLAPNGTSDIEEPSRMQLYRILRSMNFFQLELTIRCVTTDDFKTFVRHLKSKYCKISKYRDSSITTNVYRNDQLFRIEEKVLSTNGLVTTVFPSEQDVEGLDH